MKLKLIVVVLVSLFGTLNAVPLNCKFHGHNSYACIVIGLENHNESLVFSNISGKHAQGKSNDDVAALVIKTQNVSFVPIKIGVFFTNLRRYEVKNSSLVTVKQENFKDLEQIDTLVLSNNLITTLSPGVFDDLKQLRRLHLSANKLQQVPYGIFSNNTNLELITLDNNQIMFIHEELFMELTNLVEIYLQNNEIEDLREQTFAKNERLTSIDVRNNKLMSVGPQLLKGLKNLTTFKFTNNFCIKQDYVTVEDLTNLFKTSCFPPYFKSYEERVKVLTTTSKALNDSLINCEIELEAEKTSLTDLESRIETLKEEKSSVDNEHTECISEKDKAETDLATCKDEIEEKDKLLLKATQNLTECESIERDFLNVLTITNKTVAKTLNDITKCKLQVDTLTKTINMMELHAHDPIIKLTKEVDDLTSKNKQLNLQLQEITEQLKSKDNELTKQLTSNIEKLTLENAGNELRSCDAPPEVNTEFQKHLKEVQAQLTTCDFNLKSCINQLPVCNSFFIDCTYLTVPKTNEYTCYAKHVSACQPGMKLNTNGVHLHDKTNTKVNALEIQDSIFHFTDDIFKHFPNLRKIQITNAGLSTLEPALKSSILKKLIIEGNRFNEIPGEVFSGLKALELLFLDMNDIETLYFNSFAGLVSLRHLSLKSNMISELPLGVFDDLINLTHLTLKHNQLRSLSGNLLQNNPRLEVVDFDDNSELSLIGTTLLDFSKSLRIGNFGGTCVRTTYNENIRELRNSITAHCQ